MRFHRQFIEDFCPALHSPTCTVVNRHLKFSTALLKLSTKKLKKNFLNFQDLNDFLSDSEPDVSQYQAEVCSSFQTVALVNTNPQQPIARLQQSSSSPKFLNLEQHRRKIPLSEDLKIDDDSSPEELSFRADDDDDDNEPFQINLLSDNKAVNGNFCDSFGATGGQVLNSASHECIPEYSAADESRNVRNFMLITLPDGKTREIDMKVSWRIFYAFSCFDSVWSNFYKRSSQRRLEF